MPWRARYTLWRVGWPPKSGLLERASAWDSCSLWGGLLAMVSGFSIGARWGVGGALLLGLGVAGMMVARSESALWRWSWICAVFLVGFVAHGACFRPILSPSPLPKLTRELLAMKPEPATIYVYEAQTRVPGIIRILSGGKLNVQSITSIPAEGTNFFPSPIVDPQSGSAQEGELHFG